MNNVKLMLMFLLFFSCSNRVDVIKKKENVRDNTKMNEIESFETFWNEFSHSLKSNDTLTLMSLSLPEIEVGTIDNSDRTFSFKDKEVAQIILFEYQNGGYYDYEKDRDVSNIEMIDLPLSELRDYRKDSADQQINNFVFSKSKNGWKLTGLYTKIDSYFKNHPRK